VTKGSVSHEPLPFIHDDYPRALAEAKKQNKPIFVDAWAPWCHSCLSMKSFVLNDPVLEPIAKDYVWLAIDTERENNAPFVAKFTHDALPTLWVIRAEDEAVAWKWTGTLTALELRDALSNANAAREAETPARAAHDRVMQLAKGDESECAKLALARAKELPRGTPRADILATGLDCARDAKLAAEMDALVAMALKDAVEGGAALLADDRSALFEEVVDTKTERGDEAGAKAIAAQWASFLEAQASQAKTPAARAVFDAHRVEAYLALGEPARAVPMLLESERDFPADYNPPARLARAYLQMNDLEKATAAIDRARARVYGPRVMLVLSTAADIAKARGDREGEKKALEEALARTEKAALTAGQKASRNKLAKRLLALTTPHEEQR
jgi:thiol-disulfide isomerase/thioredoxin